MYVVVPRSLLLWLYIHAIKLFAVNTHVHADHITGSGKLKGLVPGSKSMLSGDSGAKADIYLDQGEKINIGEIELEARKTPGHTNGKCWYSKGLTTTITCMYCCIIIKV